MCDEVWVPVLGLEAEYEVSSLGRVRSLARVVECANGARRTLPGGILAAHQAGNTCAGKPYLRLMLQLRGEKLRMYVHQLVAWHFLGNPPQGAHIHHLNGDTHDNRACNLAYVAACEHHRGHAQGERNPNATLCEADVRTIRRLLADGQTVAAVARVYAVSHHTISRIRRGVTWAHVGQDFHGGER